MPSLPVIDFASQAKRLKPTATVVRGRDGRVKVERQELLSSSEQQAKIAASMEAGKKRGELKQDYQTGSIVWKQGVAKSSTDTTKDRIYPTHEGAVYEFHPDLNCPDWKRGEWQVATETVSHESVLFGGQSPCDKSIKVATFNIWFDLHEWKIRTRALLDLLVTVEDVDIICLQEVTPRCLAKILERADIRQAYRVTDQGPAYKTLGRYGVAMLVRRTLPLPTMTWVSLPTRMGRSALVASFELPTPPGAPQNTLAIATVHLESLNSRDTRAQQLERIRTALKQYSVAALMGDYNISATGPHGSQEEHQSLNTLMKGYDDLWVQEHGTGGDKRTSPRFFKSITFNSTSNAMLRDKQKRIGEPLDHARLDRVLVRTNNDIRAHGIRILGDQPIGPNGLCISDHFGLAFELSVSESKGQSCGNPSI